MTHTPTSPHPADAAADDRRSADVDRSAGLSRRAVVAGVGGVAAAGLLTACGGGSTATAPAAPAAAPPAAPSEAAAEPSAAGGSAASSSGTALAATTEIPVGGGKVFADKDVVVTQPTSGDFKAFSATCTHQGCKVKSVTDGQIVCPCHGSKFNATDGSVTAGPAKRPLPTKTVSVEGDSVVLA